MSYWVKWPFDKQAFLDGFGLPRYPCDERQLYGMLLTGEYTDRYAAIPGLFKARQVALREESGWPEKAFDDAFANLVKAGLVEADWGAPVVCLPAELHQHLPPNPNIVTGWVRYLYEHVPACQLRERAIEEIAFHMRRTANKGLSTWVQQTGAIGEHTIFGLWNPDDMAANALASNHSRAQSIGRSATAVANAQANALANSSGGAPANALANSSATASAISTSPSRTNRLTNTMHVGSEDLRSSTEDHTDQDPPPTPRGRGARGEGKVRPDRRGAARPPADVDGDRALLYTALTRLSVAGHWLFSSGLVEGRLPDDQESRWLKLISLYRDGQQIDNAELFNRLDIAGMFIAQGGARFCRGVHGGVLGVVPLSALFTGSNFQRLMDEALLWRRQHSVSASAVVGTSRPGRTVVRTTGR